MSFGTGGCRCGHLDPHQLRLLAPAVVAVWVGSLFGWFVVRAAIAAAPVWFFCKVITDTLWDSHEPWWPAETAPEFLLVHPRVAVRLTIVGALAGSALAVRWVRLRRDGVRVTPLSLVGMQDVRW